MGGVEDVDVGVGCEVAAGGTVGEEVFVPGLAEKAGLCDVGVEQLGKEKRL